MKQLKLTGKYGTDKIVLVDDEDFLKVCDTKWALTKLGYPLKTTFENGKTHATRKAKTVYLHRVILSAPKGMVVDHINQDKLDNQKSNLRIATHGQNHLNQGLQKNNTSGYKGVVWAKSKNKWASRLKVNGKNLFLGYFEKPLSAAIAYNLKAKEVFGEFALLNNV